MSAAVADFTFDPHPVKWKRADGPVPMIPRPSEDIVASLVERRRPGQIIVGFAAETGDPEEAARAKWRSKGVDLMVGNDVTVVGAGFESPTNEVVIVSGEGAAERLSRRSKSGVAEVILAKVEELLARGD